MEKIKEENSIIFTSTMVDYNNDTNNILDNVK